MNFQDLNTKKLGDIFVSFQAPDYDADSQGAVMPT